MARFNIFDVIRVIDLADLPEILRLYTKYRSIIEQLLENNTPGIINPPNRPPESNPPIELPPAAGQVYFKLVSKVFFNERDNVVVDLPQMRNDRVHIDISPFDNNDREIRTGDPRHVKVPNDVPVRYRWWRDGKLNTHAEYSGMPAQEDDHFHLESVRDADNGFTPVLRLVNTEPGGHKVEFEAFIPAEFNGGVEVVSNRIDWICD